ncbi:MAG TPA: hydrogenase maturation protease [Thermoplasmata archaeon]|nr:hydrogenase maturation protease [Thermoplasmata archaeon]
MTYVPQRNLEARLRDRLRHAKRVAVVGVGDELNVHDRLGMLAAKEVDGLHLANVRVFLAGTVPESVTGPIRRYRPDAILLLDAADMGARPGTVALVEPREVRANLLSTHALPLSVVMEFLEKDAGARVTLVGIQPDLDAEGFSPAGPEQAGLTRLVVSLFHVLGEPPSRPPRVARAARPRAGRGSRAL